MRFLKLLAIFPLFVVIGCATTQTTQPGEVGVTRGQHIHPYMIGEVHTIATRQYSSVIEQARREGRLNQNPQQLSQIRTITNDLITQTRVFREDAQNWHWEMNIISSPEINAWCMPGGKMAIYTGFIEQLQPTDDELAAVIGHEIAHALRLHTVERISRQVSQGLLLEIAIQTGVIDQRREDIANLVTQLTLTLPNSREHEREADRMGVELAARAGYNPNGAITLWQKMSRLSRSNRLEFLSTHPSSDSRVRDLRPIISRIMPLRQLQQQVNNLNVNDERLAFLAANMKNVTALIITNHGNIEIEFFPDLAPIHCFNFITRAESGYYNGTKFHRVISGFIIQGGDPNTKRDNRNLYGQGGPIVSIPNEFNNTSHEPGILSMARVSDVRAGAGSQFFIMHGHHPNLDNEYTAFGRVTSGMNVVNTIATIETSSQYRDQPMNHVVIERIEVFR